MTPLGQAVIDASIVYFNSDTKENRARWNHAVKCFERGLDQPLVKPKSSMHVQLEKELGQNRK